jgi:activator of HSP90 ATPase
MAKPKSSVTAKPAKAAARDATRTSQPPHVREKLEIATTVRVEPAALYAAWLDGREHGAFTGGQASCEAHVGGRFTAWDGYIEGENLELEPGKRIVQSWRTSDFEDDDPDSRLEIRFEPAGKGATKIVVTHTDLPLGGAHKYREGWKQHYFTPMSKYYGEE